MHIIEKKLHMCVILNIYDILNMCDTYHIKVDAIDAKI